MQDHTIIVRCVVQSQRKLFAKSFITIATLQRKGGSMPKYLSKNRDLLLLTASLIILVIMGVTTKMHLWALGILLGLSYTLVPLGYILEQQRVKNNDSLSTKAIVLYAIAAYCIIEILMHYIWGYTPNKINLTIHPVSMTLLLLIGTELFQSSD